MKRKELLELAYGYKACGPGLEWGAGLSPTARLPKVFNARNARGVLRWFERAGGRDYAGWCIGRLISVGSLVGVRLSDENLQFAVLHKANLSGAKLDGADLRCVDLTKADLTGADLSGAKLGGAWLNGAKLDGAKLTHTRLVDLPNASLRFADLRGANLRGACMSNADLSGADLSGVDLSGADLSGAVFRGADLSGADLTSADLRKADLTRVDLRWARLDGADLDGARLDNALMPEGWEGVVLARGRGVLGGAILLLDQLHPGVPWHAVNIDDWTLEGSRAHRRVAAEAAVIGCEPADLVEAAARLIEEDAQKG